MPPPLRPKRLRTISATFQEAKVVKIMEIGKLRPEEGEDLRYIQIIEKMVTEIEQLILKLVKIL